VFILQDLGSHTPRPVIAIHVVTSADAKSPNATSATTSLEDDSRTFFRWKEKAPGLRGLRPGLQGGVLDG